MTGRARELLVELVDSVRAARALPHVIERSAELELRVMRLEADTKVLRRRIRRLNAIVDELYLGSAASDAEVPDA